MEEHVIFSATFTVEPPKYGKVGTFDGLKYVQRVEHLMLDQPLPYSLTLREYGKKPDLRALVAERIQQKQIR